MQQYSNFVRALFAVATIVLVTLRASIADDALEPRFTIDEFRVEGNHVLDTAIIEQTLYPFLGEKRGAADVEAARATLEKTYRAQGYAAALVDVPPQKVEQGVVSMRVREGVIGRLRVSGSRYFSLDYLRRQIPALNEGAVLNGPPVQQQLVALGGFSADRVVTPVLRAGREPGTVDVDLRVADHLPLHGEWSLDDRYTPDSEPLRTAVALHYDNLWQRAHSLTLQAQTAPQDTKQVRVYMGSYLWRFSDSPSALAMYAVKTDSSASTVGDLQVNGSGDIAGLRWMLSPDIGENAFSHTFSLSMDYKNFRENIKLAGADARNTPLRYGVLGAQYNGAWRGETTRLRINTGVNAGARAYNERFIDCDGQSLEQFECKRHEAKPNFIYFRGGGELAQTWWAGIETAFSGSAQISEEPLVSNEQFVVGGAESVRGYPESSALGDLGARVSVELRSPSIGRAWWSALTEWRFLGFADAGATAMRHPLPGEVARHYLAGAGIGMRLRMWQNIQLEVDGAHALRAAGKVNAGDDRVHFRLTMNF